MFSMGRLSTRLRGAVLFVALGAFLSGCVANQDRFADARYHDRFERLSYAPTTSGQSTGARVGPPLSIASAPSRTVDWRDYFSDISKGAILIRLDDRRLTYWEPGGAQTHEFPIAVPRTDDLTRTGATHVAWQRKNPDWRPTPSMIAENPNIPRYIGPGPHNPMGERAIYLGWTYYAIHGTNDPNSIGTRATAGCFRLHPDDVEWLYDQIVTGMPVRVVETTVEAQRNYRPSNRPAPQAAASASL